ncbi:phosphatase inhibitor-domain-containing protein [Gamsiella multidivaricata]|uniref:phosphatase inhibitor-domain-containing protein n=2 Tax=Gamsiella multidivaricata TaxID=101098 RepID=UPI00221F8AF8|nr:phosphatase inhibitor-domain-containing protein [Gamsiella multidivaricata]KAI7820332.1 phosphatase inhibitor-domain-containing protein [Gamsiella multidivaricata]
MWGLLLAFTNSFAYLPNLPLIHFLPHHCIAFSIQGPNQSTPTLEILERAHIMTPTYDATNDIYGPEGPPTISSLIANNRSEGGAAFPVSGGLRVAGSARQPATYGSRTMTLDPTQIEEEDPAEESHDTGVLELTGESSSGRRVQWDDDVVDNEHMGKKKSKICCIFKKQKEFGESSDESSSDSDSDSSGSESDGGPVSSNPSKGKSKGKDGNGPCDHSDPNHHHHHGSKKAKKRVLNEYERMPKVKLSQPAPVNQ